MIRHLLFALLLSGPAAADLWHCDHALMPAPQTHEIETFSFTLELQDDGQFSARRVAGQPDTPHWSWQGQWMMFENEIAMIGTTDADWTLRYTPQAGLTQRELRAHSAWVAQDVIILNVMAEDDAKLVRCLSEGL